MGWNWKFGFVFFFAFFNAVLAHSAYKLWHLTKCSDKQVNINHCLCTCPHEQCGSRTKQANKWAVRGLDFMVLSICPQPLCQKSPSLLVLSIKHPNAEAFLASYNINWSLRGKYFAMQEWVWTIHCQQPNDKNIVTDCITEKEVIAL